MLTSSPIPVLFCTDINYWQHLGAALASLLASNSRHRFRIFICSMAPHAESEARVREIVSRFGNATVEFIQFRPDLRDELPISGHITLGAYLRLYMAEYIDPSVDKLLYLDCDLIVRKDIGALWAADIRGYLAAAALEPYLEPHYDLGFTTEDPYFNSGVMLINLAAWRREKLLGSLLACAREQNPVLDFWDQDILNTVLRGRVAFLHPRWNFLAIYAEMRPEQLRLTHEEFHRLRRDPDIIHFTTAFKPWQYMSEPQYKRCYWEALSLTPWKDTTPVGYTPVNVLRKTVRMKHLKQPVRLHGAAAIYLLSRLLRRPMLWSHVCPPPSPPTFA